MIKPILQIGDPILTTKTKVVEDPLSAETKKIVADLLDTCIANADISAGLAAPQIGYDKAICVCRRVDLEEANGENPVADEQLWEVLINPKIITSSTEETMEWEACLSIGIGDDNIWGPVSRPKNVTVGYTTPEGENKQLVGVDYFGHILQHEYDHLQGVLFITYIDNPSNLWKLKDLNAYVDENEEYPEIV